MVCFKRKLNSRIVIPKLWNILIEEQPDRGGGGGVCVCVCVLGGEGVKKGKQKREEKFWVYVI